MSDELRIYYSFRSPYSRLGLHKVARAKLPELLLTRLIPFTGPANDAPFFDPMSSPPKFAYYAEDAPRMTTRMGLEMKLPDPFDVSYSRAYKAFFMADREGKGLDYALAVSDARWGEGRNVSDMDVLSTCATIVGLDADMPATAKSDQSLNDALEKCAIDINKDQAFGVPFAVLEKDGRIQKFWGQDRFDLLVETLIQ